MKTLKTHYKPKGLFYQQDLREGVIITSRKDVMYSAYKDMA
ncbi:MAG: hypothetical protein AAGL34_15565 [Bacteroidota bacterium]